MLDLGDEFRGTGNRHCAFLSLVCDRRTDCHVLFDRLSFRFLGQVVPQNKIEDCELAADGSR